MKKRIISLALVLNLLWVSALPVGVSAQSADGSVTVSAQITSSYSIDVQSSINLTSAPNIINSVSTIPFTITVTSNDTSSSGLHHATVKVKGTDGKLSTGLNTNVLSPALQISSVTTGWTVDVIRETDSDTYLSLDAASGSVQVTDLVITQPTVTFPTPIPAGTYQEVLTFTASFSSSAP